MERRRPSALFL